MGDQHTLLSIIWSCLATIFACTWLAVHPNVPDHNITMKGAISCAIEHAKIMAIAILAPEVIVGWAVQQFIVVWKLRHESKLTLAHCFLLCMGGFYYPTNHEIPHQAVEAEATSSPPPSSVHETFLETIENISKGDALSKTFSILQISWFIVQCIARAIQHLPIMLLEMTALAFAGLSIITYLLWWYKPLSVKYSISLDGSLKRLCARKLEMQQRRRHRSHPHPTLHTQTLKFVGDSDVIEADRNTRTKLSKYKIHQDSSSARLVSRSL
ncbi:hypothetical protein EV421DRAFT_1719727 [Armillaria borealis]|uniref:Uncharacterized protein n=1 Tax=Armillaria borealis TaxID=47425 RepID=A0AA39MER7_9AGAR|nr:hypothetical protein EV421DRAFT_1719727 [Armillaria borealis]